MSVKVGDQVFVTDYYRSKYPLWKEVELAAKVVKVMSSTTSLERMSETDYNRFVAKYGKLRQFPLISYLIQIGSNQYLVSEFGFEPRS